LQPTKNNIPAIAFQTIHRVLYHLACFDENSGSDLLIIVNSPKSKFMVACPKPATKVNGTAWAISVQQV
jgi:hypothetical protein